MKPHAYKLILFVLLLIAGPAARAVTAGFSVDYASGCSPLVVHFTNTSSGATSYYWDLGNGTTSTLTNVSGSYITAGTYTVTLTAYSGSTSHTTTSVITVYASPTVSFYASDTGICPGSSVTFTSTSTPGVAGSMTYMWNFGDGGSSTSASPAHTYASSGYYNVTLMVTNSMGCSSSITYSRYIHVYTRPAVNFTTTSYLCNVPSTVTFTNFSTGTGTLSYYWTFGDGGTSTAATPSHTYTSLGVFTVKLVVTDANGCVDSLTRVAFITVSSFVGSFVPVTSACVGTLVTFANSSPYHISSRWDFGDGGTATTDTGRHVYGTPGTYTVQLIVSNGSCIDTVTNTIIIYPLPTASFTSSPMHPCPPPAAITYTGTVPSGSGVSWIYGDRTTGSGATTTHTYSSASIDTVMMIVTDFNGCVSTVVGYDTILDLNVTIQPNVTGGCVPLTVVFHSDVTGIMRGYSPFPYPDSVTSYSWSFGDGGTATGVAATTHTFTATGSYPVVLTITTANGCTAYDTTIISVGTPPTDSFIAVPMRVCFRDPVTFTAFTDSGEYFFWNFHDGSSAYDSFPTNTHRFTHPGIFSVTLIVYHNGCASDPFTLDSIIVDSPMAVAAVDYMCTPFTQVQFYNQSWGADSLRWAFGDGTFSTADSPLHNYPSTGTYTAELYTYNVRSGCRDTTIFPVLLNPPIMAALATDTTICKNEPITFTPVITGGSAANFYWYVGGVLLDNDTGAVFTDTFRAGGRFTVMLVITDEHGCLDTLTKPNWITVGNPIDSFIGLPVSGCGPLSVTFIDRSTDVSGLSITRFNWEFGDGGTATGTTGSVAHTYTAAGVYSVKSVITDNIGCMDSLTRASYVSVYRPVAVFTASTTVPCAGSPVTFYNSSSGITGSYWMFGDGDTSTTTSPNHTYTASGSYTVKLVVWDSHGCTDTATYVNYINVTRATAAFTMSDTFTICPPLNVHFYNSSTGAVSYAWEFGDGGTSLLPGPTNLYLTAGYYTVMLIAINANGCRDTVYHNVNAYGYAGAFAYAPLTGCSPLTVHFSAALSNVPNIIWDFADGTTTLASYSDTTSHTYMLPGAYVPKLILSDNTGCQNSSLGIDTIKVNAVIPGFTTVPHPVCVNTDVYFRDTSFSFFSTDSAWFWRFSATDTSSLPYPMYHYSVTGTFPVTLTVWDKWGCTGTITRNVVVNPPPTIKACPDTVICVGDTAALWATGGRTYSWAPSASIICNTCIPATANPTTITTFTVTGTDSNGCQNTDTIQVGMRTHTFSEAWPDSEVCQMDPVQLFDTGGTKYWWYPAAGLSNPRIYNPIATPATTTTYMAIAQLAGCIPDTNYVTLIVHQLPTVNAGPDQTIMAGQPTVLTATGTFIHTALWSPAATLLCDTCLTTTSTAISTTTYSITVYSDFGCKATDDVTLTYYCDDRQIFIPNTFTPNGDGQNDVFYPRGSGVSKVKTFRIYNRWGELLFERLNFDLNDVSAAWDGSYNGASARPDVYVYLIEATCGTGEPLFLKGDVTIIK